MQRLPDNTGLKPPQNILIFSLKNTEVIIAQNILRYKIPIISILIHQYAAVNHLPAQITYYILWYPFICFIFFVYFVILSTFMLLDYCTI